MWGGVCLCPQGRKQNTEFIIIIFQKINWETFSKNYEILTYMCLHVQGKINRSNVFFMLSFSGTLHTHLISVNICSRVCPSDTTCLSLVSGCVHIDYHLIVKLDSRLQIINWKDLYICKRAELYDNVQLWTVYNTGGCCRGIRAGTR